MKKKPKTIATPAALRRSAEARVRTQKSKVKADGPADAKRLLHELQVHQVELEMQNTELRKTRDELEVALENYTELYDFAPAGYLTLTENGTIQLLNLTGASLIGIERSRLVGKNFGRLFVEEERPQFTAFLKQVFASKEKQTRDFELAGSGMPHRTVKIRAQQSPNGKECSAVIVDITERTLAEAAHRASEIRYRRLFETAHDGVLLLDPATRKITDANPFMTKLLGYPHKQLVGKELFEIGLLKDEAASQEMFRKLKRKHEVRYEDLPLKSKSGRLQEVEVVANLYEEDGRSVIQCNIRDITARKREEDTLRKSAELFSALIEQAPIGVYVLDSQFRMQKVNAIALPGFESVKPLIGRDFAEVVRIIWPKKVADNVIARFRHTLKTGEPYQSPEFTERRKDTGDEEVYEWQILQIILPEGERGVVCFFDNVTKRRKAEEAQRHLDIMTATNKKLEKEITQRQEAETKLKLSQQTTAELYEKAGQQKDGLRHLARKLLTAQEEERKRISRELHDVIAQTLTGINVRLASLKAESNALIPDLLLKIAHTQQMVEQSVDIVHRFARELRPSMLDDLGLLPALQSFVKKFTEETGIRVSIKAFEGIEEMEGIQRTVLYRISQEALTNVCRHAKATSAEISIQNHEGTISMEVTDNGKGFEVVGTGSAKKNNRLGLLGMRERVEMIGGTFSINSAPGKNTTVRVEVPATIEEAKNL